MEKSPFIVKFYVKAYEDQTIEELREARAGIKTVEDLATHKYVRLAQGINCFSECSGQILDKAFESQEYANLRKKPVSAISGVSREDALLLKKAFGIDNIQELADNKYVAVAQTTVAMASLVKVLQAVGAL